MKTCTYNDYGAVAGIVSLNYKLPHDQIHTGLYRCMNSKTHNNKESSNIALTQYLLTADT